MDGTPKRVLSTGEKDRMTGTVVTTREVDVESVMTEVLHKDLQTKDESVPSRRGRNKIVNY